MTEHDPMRALDRVDPPEQWDDIVARAASPATEDLDVPMAAARRPRVLLAAAAVLVVLGVVGALVVARHVDDPAGVQAGPGAPLDPPTAIWGRTWWVTGIVEGGRDQGVVPASEAPLALDATTRGSLGFSGCNGAGGAVELDGDRVAPKGRWFHTAKGCIGDPSLGDPSALMDQDAWLDAFLRAGPTVEVRGDALSLVHGEDRVDLVDRTSFGTIRHDLLDRVWTVDRVVLATDPVDLPDETDPDQTVALRFQVAPHSVPYGVLMGDVVLRTPECPQRLLGFSATYAPGPGASADRVRTEAPSASDCRTAAGEAVARILGADPVVQIRDGHLVLAVGRSRIEATATGGGRSSTGTTELHRDPSATTTTSPDTPYGPPHPVDPKRFFGARWKLERIEGLWTVADMTDVVVDTTDPPFVKVSGCIDFPLSAHVDGDRLVVDADSRLIGCEPPEVTPLLRQRDAVFDEFWKAGPTVAVSSDGTATLTAQVDPAQEAPTVITLRRR